MAVHGFRLLPVEDDDPWTEFGMYAVPTTMWRLLGVRTSYLDASSREYSPRIASTYLWRVPAAEPAWPRARRVDAGDLDAAPGEDVAALVASAHAFAAATWKRLSSEHPENLVLASHGLFTALAACRTGATAAIAETVATGLALPLDPERTERAARTLHAQLLAAASGDGSQIDLDTAIVLPPEITVARDVAARVELGFGARIEVASGDQAAAIRAGGSFQGTWETPFDPADTADGVFRLATGETARVPLMHRVARSVVIGSIDDADLLALDYRGSTLRLVLVLPKNGDLPALERTLDGARIAAWLGALTLAEDVPITIPRFRLESNLSLDRALQDGGFAILFDSTRANILGTTAWLQSTREEVSMGVDERGTTVAWEVELGLQDGTPHEFHANRPFLAMLVERDTGCLLVLARLTDPR